MLELDDIQHFLLTRPRAMAARYGFLCFRRPEDGRAWLAGIIDRIGTGRSMSGAGETDSRWVTVAFTWHGLRARLQLYWAAHHRAHGRRGPLRDSHDSYLAAVLGDDLEAMRLEIAGHMRRGMETTERFLDVEADKFSKNKGRKNQ